MTKLLFALLLCSLPGLAAAQHPASVEIAVKLRQVYASHLMGMAERSGLDQKVAATGAPAPVAAFFQAVLRGDPVLALAHLTLPDRGTLRLIFAVDSVQQMSATRPRPDPADVARAALSKTYSLQVLAPTTG